MREILMRLRRKLAEELQQPRAEFKLSLSVSDVEITSGDCTEYRLRVEINEKVYTVAFTVSNLEFGQAKFNVEQMALDHLIYQIVRGIKYPEKKSSE